MSFGQKLQAEPLCTFFPIHGQINLTGSLRAIIAAGPQLPSSTTHTEDQLAGILFAQRCTTAS